MSGKILALHIKSIDNIKLETCIIARGEKKQTHTREYSVKYEGLLPESSPESGR